MFFLVVMYGGASWTIKKAERRRIDTFKLWCWGDGEESFFFPVLFIYLRRVLRLPWTKRTSNQSILKEISSEYSLEGLMLKVKLQYFGHLMQRADSLEKTLIWERLRAGGEEGDRG